MRRCYVIAALLLASCGRTARQSGEASSSAGGAATTAGAASTAGTTSASGAGGDAALDCTAPQPGAKPLITLTNYQLNRTLADLFPGATSLTALEPLAEMRREDAQHVNSYYDASDLHVWAHDAAALLSNDTAALAQLRDCAAAEQPSTDCRDQLIEQLASRAFRHPLSDDERSELAEVFADGQKLGGSFNSGVRAVIEIVLQSPEFLYLVELGNGRVEGDAAALTGYESAARLALFLTGTLPDTPLSLAAAAPELTAAELEQHARRLLGSPANRDQTAHFYARLLGFIDEAQERPDYDRALVAMAREESSRFIGDVSFDGAGTFRALLTEPTTWVNERLATLYGYPGVKGDAFQKVQLDPTQRGGLLTQSAFLAGTSHSSLTSPVWRGQAVLRKLLCWDGPPPPPNVPPTPPLPEDFTTRQKFEALTAGVACQDCHKIMDPVGFAFEHYDQAGRYRSSEHDKPIDSSGELRFSDASGPFADALELLKRIAESPDAQACFTRHWLEEAQGSPAPEQESCAEQSALSAFTQSDGKLSELMLAIAKTDGFRYRLSSELSP